MAEAMAEAIASSARDAMAVVVVAVAASPGRGDIAGDTAGVATATPEGGSATGGFAATVVMASPEGCGFGADSLAAAGAGAASPAQACCRSGLSVWGVWRQKFGSKGSRIASPPFIPGLPVAPSVSVEARSEPGS